MFRVPTYLAPSGIHGMGVFTPEAIPAGTVIWDFDPGVDWRLERDELEQFPEPYRSRIRRYCYLDRDSGTYILCGDNAKFMNHSFEPNCDDSGARTIAARDIEPFEELTCDYTVFDAESSRQELERTAAPADAEAAAGDGRRAPRRAKARGGGG